MARRRLDGRLGVAGLRNDVDSRRVLEQATQLEAHARVAAASTMTTGG